MRFIACDPGNEKSALVIYDAYAKTIGGQFIGPNKDCRLWLKHLAPIHQLLVMEYTKPYVRYTKAKKPYFPSQVMLTAREQGRFQEIFESVDRKVDYIFRQTVKAHIAGKATANDSEIRKALLDRYGGERVALGKKASPGPLWGIKADLWQALAAGIAYAEKKLKCT